MGDGDFAHDVLKAAFITMMNKLIYAHRMILKP